MSIKEKITEFKDKIDMSLIINRIVKTANKYQELHNEWCHTKVTGWDFAPRDRIAIAQNALLRDFVNWIMEMDSELIDNIVECMEKQQRNGEMKYAYDFFIDMKENANYKKAFKAELINSVASELHEDWRKTRLNKDGSYEPRWKAIKDQNFIKRLNPNQLSSNYRMISNGFEIDIANSTYDQLSPDWQYENLEAAKVASDLVLQKKWDDEDFTQEQIGDKIHNEWLKRNTYAKGTALDVPFTELPEEEKVKDLSQYKLANTIANKMIMAEKEKSKQQSDDGVTM